MMSRKSKKIAALIENCHGRDLDPHYLGYCECFNRQLFYEAHDVLEELWLADKQGPNHSFYKGLIQLAGAFVHLQKNRLRPAASLFKLARANLGKYSPVHERLDLAKILTTIDEWLSALECTHYSNNPLASTTAPRLHILGKSE